MLHTVNKSPFGTNSLDTCVRLARPGSAILLIEDGVYAAARGTAVESTLREAVRSHRVYVLGPDLKSRGIEQDTVIEGIEVVGYDDFVRLTVEHDRVQSWL